VFHVLINFGLFLAKKYVYFIYMRIWKAKNGWNDRDGKSGNGTDDYGFSALPGSLRHFNGKIGYNAFWWTANIGYRRGVSVSDYFYEGDCHPALGLSVRCIQD
jgi:uncharacterized protein (TIGR02145 family)